VPPLQGGNIVPLTYPALTHGATHMRLLQSRIFLICDLEEVILNVAGSKNIQTWFKPTDPERI